MKKTISGVLLALTAVFALVACGKKDKKTTTKKTGGDTTPARKTGTINWYCWNEEIKDRLNNLYDQVEKSSGNETTLKDGIKIKWIQSPNQSSVFQNNLDTALTNGVVDMFCFEADYATKYVKSDYVADMTELGIDQKDQYQYTKDIVTNAAGKLVGSSWQGTPGIIVYNKTVAEAVLGASATAKDVQDALSTDFDTFKATAAKAKTAGKTMMIGVDDWFRTYSNNMAAKCWDGTNITVDKQLFQWAKDTKEFADAGYIEGLTAGYGLWGADWGTAQGKDNSLCIFSCPWFTDFCLKGYRHDAADDPDKLAIKDMKDSGLRAAAGYKSWFWGGTWLTATKDGVANANIKDDIKDIIAKMTTDADVLYNLATTYGDFTNSKTAMAKLSEAEAGNLAYFGGENVYKFYAAAVEKADLSKASDYDQQICENLQNCFRSYFLKNDDEGHTTAEKAWTKFVSDLSEATSVKTANIKMADGVTVTGDTITIA